MCLYRFLCTLATIVKWWWQSTWFYLQLFASKKRKEKKTFRYRIIFYILEASPKSFLDQVTFIPFIYPMCMHFSELQKLFIHYTNSLEYFTTLILWIKTVITHYSNIIRQYFKGIWMRCLIYLDISRLIDRLRDASQTQFNCYSKRVNVITFLLCNCIVIERWQWFNRYSKAQFFVNAIKLSRVISALI